MCSGAALAPPARPKGCRRAQRSPRHHWLPIPRVHPSGVSTMHTPGERAGRHRKSRCCVNAHRGGDAGVVGGGHAVAEHDGCGWRLPFLVQLSVHLPRRATSAMVTNTERRQLSHTREELLPIALGGGAVAGARRLACAPRAVALRRGRRSRLGVLLWRRAAGGSAAADGEVRGRFSGPPLTTALAVALSRHSLSRSML